MDKFFSHFRIFLLKSASIYGIISMVEFSTTAIQWTLKEQETQPEQETENHSEREVVTMARVSMVTRTIKGTRASVMCLDVVSCEPFNQTVEFPETFKSEDKLLKTAQAQLDTDTVKAVHIADVEEFETLYGMPETTFLKYASVLPPRKTADATEE